MADPLSIAAGVAGLLTLSSAIVETGFHFINSEGLASKELAELVKEIAYLNGLLLQIVFFQSARSASLGNERTTFVEQIILFRPRLSMVGYYSTWINTELHLDNP
jgi:hypothetical protein